MINKITYQEEPTLFEDITEYSIEEIMYHRRGSSFYREDIIEFTTEDSSNFPEIEEFEKYIGTWKTNNALWDDNDGFENGYSELVRVEKREKISYDWVEV